MGWWEKHSWETNTDRLPPAAPYLGWDLHPGHVPYLEIKLETCQSTRWPSNQLNRRPGLLLLLKHIFQSGKRDERWEEQEIDCNVAGDLFVKSQQKTGKLLCGVWGKYYRNSGKNKDACRATREKCTSFLITPSYVISQYIFLSFNVVYIRQKKITIFQMA